MSPVIAEVSSLSTPKMLLSTSQATAPVTLTKASFASVETLDLTVRSAEQKRLEILQMFVDSCSLYENLFECLSGS